MQAFTLALSQASVAPRAGAGIEIGNGDVYLDGKKVSPLAQGRELKS